MHDRIAAASQDESDEQAPRFMGHVAAAPVPGQVMTPKYLEARPQGTLFVRSIVGRVHPTGVIRPPS
jgi:hypothetical protein